MHCHKLCVKDPPKMVKLLNDKQTFYNKKSSDLNYKIDSCFGLLEDQAVNLPKC